MLKKITFTVKYRDNKTCKVISLSTEQLGSDVLSKGKIERHCWCVVHTVHKQMVESEQSVNPESWLLEVLLYRLSQC